jgi:hypothetical protein
MKTVKRQKCVVEGCANHTNEGEFVGSFCRPCYEFATTGSGMFSQSYRNALQRMGRLFGLTIGSLFAQACDPTVDVGIRGFSLVDKDHQDLARRKKG